MKRPFRLVVWIASCVLASCVGTRGTGIDPDYLYDELGTWHRPVSTDSPLAQRFVDQGLVLAYSFNHDEAIRSFTRATEIDPRCAMAWWGIALCHGPHINFPMMPPEKSAAAWAALQRARDPSMRADAKERGLIEALSKRYAEHPPEDRRPLDEAYAAAMREMWRAWPDDPDVGALLAESLMDLHPWDLYAVDGTPRAWTSEIVAVLESVLAREPMHPAANHLYVHAVEASSNPARANAAADRLRTLVPDASHMVHMPSHIDIRTGRYQAAVEANQRAMAVDREHERRTGRTGFYRVYMAHNTHFLAFASMMEGRSATALEAAHDVVNGFPPELLERMGPFVDGFLPIVLETQVRFGRWNDILREPRFPDLFGVSNAVRHYARGVAFTALGRLEDAEKELVELDGLCAAMDDRPIGNNPAKVVLQIPQHVLRGEWLFRKGEHDAGLAELRAAVAIEDTLTYDEPPDWLMPVRHTLGATLVTAGRYAEAEKAYREDLVRFPENGWSLLGLSRALEGQGKSDEAASVRARFERAWARADVTLPSSCFCQPAAARP